MMGTLSSKQRQQLIDIVTSVVMHDAYGLKRTVLQIAQPQGEINHGALLCTSSALNGENVAAVTIIFRGIGLVGLVVALYIAQRLYREMKQGK